MARLNINPTRMELAKLKNKLRVADRGHKLLKDKFDEMMRQFRARMKLNRDLREGAEEKINGALGDFLIARTQLSNQEVEDALAMPASAFSIRASIHSIMGVSIPKIEFVQGRSFTKTYRNLSLQSAITTLRAELGNIVQLAETEKTCEILSGEIEKTRRRINMLEHIVIPQIKETIEFISMKLAENERQNIARLLKVKQYYG